MTKGGSLLAGLCAAIACSTGCTRHLVVSVRDRASREPVVGATVVLHRELSFLVLFEAGDVAAKSNGAGMAELSVPQSWWCATLAIESPLGENYQSDEFKMPPGFDVMLVARSSTVSKRELELQARERP